MPRPLQYFVAAPQLDQLAEPQHGDAMRDLGDHAEVVRDEEHAGAVARLQVADQRKDLRLRRHVERGGGLIGDEQHRIEHQRHGDHDALALAARELVWIGRDHALGIRQPYLAHDVEDLRAPFLR